MLVAADTETTGFTCNHIVELASAIFLPNGDYYHWYSLAKPSSPIEDGAAKVHGITNDKVANERPDTEVVQEWWRDINQLSEEHNSPIVLAGHNFAYDVRAIRKYVSVPTDIPIVCTVRLGRLFTPEAPNHRLAELHEFLGLTGDFKAHSALDDVLMCYNILSYYMQTQGQTYHQLAHTQKQPVTLKVMPFGKHKGDSMSMIPVSYMRYMTGMSDLDPDVAHTFRQELARRG